MTKFSKKKIVVFGEKICFDFICSVYIKINSNQVEFSEMYLQIYIGLQGSACWFVGFGFVSFNKNPYQNISRKSAKLQLSCLMPTDGRTESYNELIIDFSNYQLNAQFFYFSTIYMLHYAPQHVSNSTLLILRRTKCITTASGIVTLQTPAYCTAAYRG